MDPLRTLEKLQCSQEEVKTRQHLVTLELNRLMESIKTLQEAISVQKQKLALLKDTAADKSGLTTMVRIDDPVLSELLLEGTISQIKKVIESQALSLEFLISESDTELRIATQAHHELELEMEGLRKRYIRLSSTSINVIAQAKEALHKLKEKHAKETP